ncbi:MAG TPA: glucose-6-phosphate dehydrogenase [Acidobacteriota bacterium]
MIDKLESYAFLPSDPQQGGPPKDPCLLVLFGASGDLTKRLLIPAFYNLACDRLLPERFAIVGVGRTEWTTDFFREKLTQEIPSFQTRPKLDENVWSQFVKQLHYTSGPLDHLDTYKKLSGFLDTLGSQLQTNGNVIFYLATPPSAFGPISENLNKAGLSRSEKGWRRIVIEKPFGHDLPSALELNREILRYWNEDQVFRIDHYLGKETVQNILAFRFANGIFESVWNKQAIDHIQLTVSESVGVEGRGGYYDKSGVLRDMIQNHMFQLLSYLCMEPPAGFRSDAIRNEKVKLLDSIRPLTAATIPHHTVRGQYGPGVKPDGSKRIGYRLERDVNPESKTETFAALTFLIDNWRWDGVPIYLRSGKALWKRGTEIVVQFKKTPEVVFRGSGLDHPEPNRLIFHIQPDQAIELRFQAKVPGPTMKLQDVNMRFGYGDVFKAARGTGYEFLIWSAIAGDPTLFSRTDLVETSWRIAQPILDFWAAEPVSDFPNYPAGSWGPRAAFDLMERDGRQWVEIINRDVLQQIPLFQNADARFLNALVMELKPEIHSAGESIVRKGEAGEEMYLISKGEVEVLDDNGQPVAELKEGNFFGELSLLLSEPRNATVRARTACDLYVLSKQDFRNAVREYPEFGNALLDVVKKRYNVK